MAWVADVVEAGAVEAKCGAAVDLAVSGRHRRNLVQRREKMVVVRGKSWKWSSVSCWLWQHQEICSSKL